MSRDGRVSTASSDAPEVVPVNTAWTARHDTSTSLSLSLSLCLPLSPSLPPASFLCGTLASPLPPPLSFLCKSSPLPSSSDDAAPSPPSQPMEVYVDDETKLTLHGLQQHYVKLQDREKNRKLFDLLDALEFNQVSRGAQS